MYNVYDFVKVVDYPDRNNKDLEQLVGKEGMVISVDRQYDYPYEVCFFDKEAQRLSLWHGSLLWCEYHLEPAEDVSLEEVKKEIERLQDRLDKMNNLEIKIALRRLGGLVQNG